MSVDCWSKELYYLIIGDFFYNPGETYQPTITQLFNGEKKWGPFSMFQWGFRPSENRDLIWISWWFTWDVTSGYAHLRMYQEVPSGDFDHRVFSKNQNDGNIDMNHE